MRRTEDLPVTVELDGPLGDEVRAFVETEGGWQPLDAHSPLPPALALVSSPRPDQPHVVVVDGRADADGVRAGLLAGALDVISWPAERARLLDVAARLPAPPVSRPRARRFAVGGTAGGVGTSTVALAVAALLAWRGRRVIVVGGDDLLALCGLAPWTGAGTAQLAVLAPEVAAEEVLRLARPVRGVPRLVAVGGGTAGVAPDAWPASVVVVDTGVVGPAERVDLLVTRLGAGFAHAIRRLTTRPPLLVVADGPVDVKQVARRYGDAPVTCVPVSARVAAAAVGGRVPADLPGSWLRALEPALTTHR